MSEQSSLLFDEDDHADEALADVVPETVNWRSLDREEAAGEWEKLHDWVSWVVVRYQLPMTTLPRCWYAHGPFVEELSALRTSWVLAYVTPGRSGQAGVDWHVHFANALLRLRMWGALVAGQCEGGKAHSAKLMFSSTGWTLSDCFEQLPARREPDPSADE